MKTKGYFLNKDGYITRYGEAKTGTSNFVPSEKKPYKKGFSLKVNSDGTAIEYVPVARNTIIPTPAQQINWLKQQLAATDYQTIKFVEGTLSEKEFAPMRTQRAAWRKEINALETAINAPEKTAIS
jgi:hypothetical protein